jgi:hypothetical protein
MDENRLKEPLTSSRGSSAPPPPDNSATLPAPGFFSQTKLLTYKNLLITFKNPKNIIFLVLTPFILSLFLYALQSLAVDNGNFVIPNPSSQSLPTFSACTWADCNSLEVSFVSNDPAATIDKYPWISAVVQAIKDESGVSASIRSKPITSFSGLQDYYSEIEQNPNRTQIGLLMCGDSS